MVRNQWPLSWTCQTVLAVNPSCCFQVKFERGANVHWTTCSLCSLACRKDVISEASFQSADEVHMSIGRHVERKHSNAQHLQTFSESAVCTAPCAFRKKMRTNCLISVSHSELWIAVKHCEALWSTMNRSSAALSQYRAGPPRWKRRWSKILAGSRSAWDVYVEMQFKAQNPVLVRAPAFLSLSFASWSSPSQSLSNKSIYQISRSLTTRDPSKVYVEAVPAVGEVT